jgi:hypothetical protein
MKDNFWKDGKKKKAQPKPKKKVVLDGENVRNGLAQLILTVVELLREVMEKQAMRRMESGSLTDDQTENLGNTFRNLKKEVDKLKKYFELEDDDLNISLGAIGDLRSDAETGKASAVDLLDRLLSKGVLLKGDVIISVADVDLVSLNLGALIASIEKANELTGKDMRSEKLEQEIKKLHEELKKYNT